jgi:hypothetical protein
MFQMIFENERVISIAGVFPVGRNKFNIIAPNTGEGEVITKPDEPLIVPLKRIFKYPSWKYPGEYAD